MFLSNFAGILLFVFFMVATGLDESKFAKILKYEYTHDNAANSYFYQYENSDGQTKEEKGEHADSSDFTVRGSYSYIGADGVTYTVHYVADKDGYHPSGDHINVPPYTPWPVNRILGDEDNGQYKPEHNYLPSSEKPPIANGPGGAILVKTSIPSTTPQPPLHSVTNRYIPSSPSPTVTIRGHSSSDFNSNVVSNGFISGNDNRNPFGSYDTNVLSNAYIPSTASPGVNSVTVSPLSHVAAASTAVPVLQVAGRNRRGRARNVAAFKKAQNDLFEVIQNNHSSQGVFKDN